ncbi:casparian strip membrane protein 1-like [Silene latifolia]|uniref:casparian strip membrane protein 1-like n=1 Tax=Silene latifolia TaxID=37657 RepID=UPI003D782C23
MSPATITIFTTLVIIFSLLQASPTCSLFILFSLYLFKSLKMVKLAEEQEQQHYSSLEVEGETSEKRNTKGKTPIMETPFIGKVAREAHHDSGSSGGSVNRGIAVIDLVIRLIALAALLAASVAMGTTNQTLPFFTQFFQFQARYYDLPTFTYFVIGNAVAATYVVLSIPFSIVTIARPLAKAPRLVLVTFDAIAATLTTSAAAAAAAIVYLAHKGNSNTNWIAICQQFGNFCQRSSGAVVASFVAALLFMFLVVLSAVSLKSR